MDAGNEAQQVLIKFAAGGYGEQVHKAWCKKGVAPKLFDVRQVGGSGSPFTMVVMEHLRPEDGWKPLHDALEQCKWRGDSCAPLKEAVLEALRTAHEVDDDGRKAVHGDARGPNILVHMGDTATESAGDIRVRFIDFDWAGFEDDAARYPRVRLSPKVKWHASVAPDAPMQQVHDSFLLERELERYA